MSLEFGLEVPLLGGNASMGEGVFEIWSSELPRSESRLSWKEVVGRQCFRNSEVVLVATSFRLKAGLRTTECDPSAS
jgi:hypothetical protein